MMRKPNFGRGKSEKTTFSVFFLIYIVFAIICIYPLIWCFINALKSTPEFLESTFTLPDKAMWKNFATALKNFKIKDQGIFDMLWNSIWQTFGGCALNILASILVAYPLARFKFPGKVLIYTVIIFRVTVPIIGSAASEYNLFASLHMVNNPSLFWMAWLSGFDMSALILYGYFRSISESYSEAAVIDGAGPFRVMWQVIIPQALPCIIALYINLVVAKWNDYTLSQIYLRSYPNLAYGLYEFSQNLNNTGGYTVYFAAILMSAIPSILIYAVAQRIMVKNMSVGGLK